MASSLSDNIFVYPDPSLLGLRFPPQQDNSIGTTLPLRPETPAIPSVTTPASPFPLDPALLARPGPNPSQVPAPDPIFAAPAPPPGPIADPVTAPRLSTAGLQSFPALNLSQSSSPTELRFRSGTRTCRVINRVVDLCIVLC